MKGSLGDSPAPALRFQDRRAHSYRDRALPAASACRNLAQNRRPPRPTQSQMHNEAQGMSCGKMAEASPNRKDARAHDCSQTRAETNRGETKPCGDKPDESPAHSQFTECPQTCFPMNNRAPAEDERGRQSSALLSLPPASAHVGRGDPVFRRALPATTRRRRAGAPCFARMRAAWILGMISPGRESAPASQPRNHRDTPRLGVPVAR